MMHTHKGLRPLPPALVRGLGLVRRLAARVLGLGLGLSLAPLLASAQWLSDGQGQPLQQMFAALRGDAQVAQGYPLADRVRAVLDHLAEGRLPEASRAINAALKLDTSNAALHFLNGLVYHVMARQGDVTKADTAIEGYRMAIRFDPGYWVAHDFLGLALFEKREYRQAQAAFAEVLLLRPDDAEALQRMMVASYLSGEPDAACAVADRLRLQDATARRGFLRSSVLVYAACANAPQAEAQRQQYFKLPLPEDERRRIDQRLADWQQLQSRSERLGRAVVGADGQPEGGVARLRTQFGPLGFPGGAGQPQGMGMQGQGVPGSAGLPAQATSSGTDRMVLVDVVMIRTEDAISTAKGINLLSALNLQFGSSSSPAFTRVTTANSPSDSGPSTIIQRSITVPALNYTLNIANANNNLNEVLARPTITALEGVRSEFFSGTVLNAAVVSSGGAYSSGSVSVEKRYGVKLALLPQILDNGMVRLAIDASRTFLKPPSSDIAFTYKLEISEILVNANVVMRLGDTLILSGLSERESTSVRDGVPLLQDVPVAQYLFSRQTQTEYQKSVLILITPRPASYTWLSDETKAAARDRPDAFSPSVDVLRARYSDWFKPYPNLASVFHHFNGADLYREFRTGDVSIDSWERMDTTRQRLKSALQFLHY